MWAREGPARWVRGRCICPAPRHGDMAADKVIDLWLAQLIVALEMAASGFIRGRRGQDALKS